MSGADTSRWTSQMVIKVAVAAAAVGCLGPLVFAVVRSGTEHTQTSRKVATVGQVSLNSSPAASSAQPPSAQQSTRPATVQTTVPGAVTTTTAPLALAATTTSTTIPSASSAAQVPVVTVVDADDGKVIMLRKGQRLRVVLQGPTWQFAEPTDSEVVSPQGSPTYVPGDNCTPLPGTRCGTVTAEFKALKAGAAIISASRPPCFQCADDHAQYRLEVKVRS